MADALDRVVEARFEQSMTVPTRFFEREAERISQACWAMARRFFQGGRLIALGNGAWATDAQHVSVEFVHLVIVGKRALPAIALTNDGALLGGLGSHRFTHQLAVIGRPQDMVLGFSLAGDEGDVVAALEQARRAGMLTLGLTGQTGGRVAAAGLDFHFSVPSDDAMVVQETHETLYHVLWELVHIFFEHEWLLAEPPPQNERPGA